MSIIKERIKFNNNTTGATITFGLSNNNRFTGYQQEIDELTKETKNDLVNPIIDHEVRRYSHVSGEGQIFLNFYFGTSPQVNFTNAGFTNSEIDIYDNKLLNSFFILDFYDKYDPYTQTKIFSTYLTKVLDGELQAGRPTPYYIISDKISQFYYWYVPESYIDTQTGTTITAYIKFSFYNAKTGKLSLFYNKDNNSLTTPEKMYFETTLNLTNMTWQINLSSSYAKAYEISSINAYVNKVNDGIENFDNQQQVYPTGNTFQNEDGTYTTV